MFLERQQDDTEELAAGFILSSCSSDSDTDTMSERRLSQNAANGKKISQQKITNSTCSHTTERAVCFVYQKKAKGLQQGAARALVGKRTYCSGVPNIK